MAPVGRFTPTSAFLHLFVLFCAPLLRAQLVHVVTPQNPLTTTTTTTTTTTSPDTTPHTPNTTSTADTFITAFHHAQKLRSAPAHRNDLHTDPQQPLQPPYDTLTRSSHLPPQYPPLTHDFLSVSPPPPPTYPAPYDPLPPPSTYLAHHPHPHHPPHPPHQPCPPTPYSSPSHPLLSFLPAKLSLKLLLKLLLKLVLFKMIVKLLAVVCLLLFIPALKTKASSGVGDGEAESEDRRARRLEAVSEAVWESLEEKKWMFGDEEEMEEMREVAELEEEEEEEENALSSPMRAVSFLRLCVSAVDRVVGYILGVLQKDRSERREDLASFVLEELAEWFKNL